MKKPQNIPALTFAITFLAILIGRIGKADAIDLVLYGVAVFSMLLFFIASNMKPKENVKEKPRRVGIVTIGAFTAALTAVIVTVLFST